MWLVGESCFGVGCQAAGAMVGGVTDALFDAVTGAWGAAFVSAAQELVAATLSALEATTAVDLSAGWFRSNVGLLAAVSLPVLVGLFVLQVALAVLRREPGGLSRAIVGVGVATVGSVVAVAVTGVALRAVDGVCQVIASSAGTSVVGAARRFLDLTWLAGPSQGPVLQMLLASGVMLGVVLLWGVLLFRKAAILLVAVFAPVAFAGAAWDGTRVWVRRWVEAVAALVVCKVVIVVVFVLGVAAFGSPRSGSAGGLSDVVIGLLLLGLAVFAPWLTFRFVHWSGIEAGTVLHQHLAASPIPAAVTGTARSARFAAQSAAVSAAVGPATAGLSRAVSRPSRPAGGAPGAGL